MQIDAYSAAAEAAAHLRQRAQAPEVAVILGSGLGAFAERLEDAVVVPYTELPHFPQVAVAGHAGQLVIGRLPGGGPRVAALAGRVHVYEGHPLDHVVHPVRTLAQWGVKAVLVTNAAGGLNPAFKPGDLMLITDHLNLTARNPLIGENDDRLGVRFPDMSEAYDRRLSDCVRQAAIALGQKLQEGVYAGLLGPSYETPAEIRMLGRMGADSVGMSTVLEVIAARHVGLKVVGISCITNFAAGLSSQPLSHAEVKETADLSREAFVALLERGMAAMGEALGQA